MNQELAKAPHPHPTRLTTRVHDESEVGFGARVVRRDTRARIDANPADWVEIPFYQGRGRDGGPPNFVRDFLAKNGIDAELVSDAPA